MNDLELCVWLNCDEKLSAEVLSGIGDDREPESIIQKLSKDELITKNDVSKLRRLLAHNEAQNEIDRAYENDAALVSWFDRAYPERLRRIADPPLVLYVKGTLPNLKQAYSVVGTRRCTPYGARVSELIGASLAQAGVVVVSGGARGIDGAAHYGAVSRGGISVAVLGTGVDVVWPPEHDKLFEKILENGGALISEYMIGASGRPWRFPKRNRIIAALSTGLIVVESPFKGGAMITAKLAVAMGKDLWAVPGRIDERVCEGSNQLLLDGASPLVNVADFTSNLCHLGQLPLFNPIDVDAEQMQILKCLEAQGDLTPDQLAARTGVSPVRLMQILTELQTQSLIYSSGGGRWRAMPR